MSTSAEVNHGVVELWEEFTHITQDPHQIIGGIALKLVQFTAFVIAVSLLAHLTEFYSCPALESLSLRKGKKSEILALILISIGSAIPELAVSTAGLLQTEESANPLIISTILSSGWISLLLIPGISALVADRGEVHLPFSLYCREIIFAIITFAVLWYSIMDNHVIPWRCALLILVYMVYLAVVSQTQGVLQANREFNREIRVKSQLVPLHETHAIDYMQILPEEIETEQESYTFTNEQSMKFRVIDRFVSLFCIRSIPGTESEKLCVVSLVNAFILEVLLSLLLMHISEDWSHRISGLPISIMGIVLALTAQISNILRAYRPVSPHAGVHAILSGFSSMILSSTVGIAVPWLIRLIVYRGNSMPKIEPNPVVFILSGLASLVGVLVLYVAQRPLCDLRQVALSRREGKLFISSFFIIVLTYVSSQFILV